MLKAKIALGVLALGITLAPAAPALAASHKPTKHHKTTSHRKTTSHHKAAKKPAQGSESSSVLCSSQTNKNSAIVKDITAATTALEAGNWPTAQKDLTAFEGQEKILNNEATSYYASAPANVQAAEHEFVTQLFPMDEKIVADSTSVSQYNTAESALFASPKWTSLNSVLSNYKTSICGSTTTTQ